tara:strand:- start:313 stop:1950 length:1638 start_codon:yes stop_codon:yes gene_type:complete
MSLTKVSYSMIQGAVYSVLDYGISTSSADNAAAITALITKVSTAGGGTIYFPTGVYNVKSEITFSGGNVALTGNGRDSVINVNAAPGFYMFNIAFADADNLTFDGLMFNGEFNYPTNTLTTNPVAYANFNVAIRVGGVSADNLRITNCFFYKLAGGSIDVNNNGNLNLVIQNNDFQFGNYSQSIINVRSPSASPVTDADRPNQVLIDGNTIYGGGPDNWYNPASIDWATSKDAIIVDQCQNFIVSNNIIRNVCGIGIRVEQSIFGTVCGNEIYECGSFGITAYKKSYYVSIVGNTIKAWGRIPPNTGNVIRIYSGSYVYATEFPSVAYNPLPADPLASSVWAVWPYDLTNVNVANVVTYSATDYYSGLNPNGILPFRGLGAISVNFESEGGVVTGNTCVGDTTQVASKYTHTSDFGYTNVHPVNNNNIVDSGKNVRVAGNYFGDVINKGIYAPIYQDPITAQGVMGIGEYNVNFGASERIDIFVGTGRVNSLYFTPQVSITTGTGTPEAVVTASPGALYLNLSGGAGTTLYVKQSGTSNTGWVGK